MANRVKSFFLLLLFSLRLVYSHRKPTPIRDQSRLHRNIIYIQIHHVTCLAVEVPIRRLIGGGENIAKVVIHN